MKKRCRTTLIFFLFTSLISLAQASTPDPAAFPLSARARGTGNAFVGLADDAGAVYYNPAGLAQISKWENIFQSGPIDDNYSYVNIASVYPTEYGVIGAGLTGFGPSGNNNDKTAVLSYSYKMKKAFIGVGYKDYGNASGKEIDLGLLLKLNNRLSFGSVVRKTLEMSNHPLTWKNGVVIEPFGSKISFKLLADFDFFPTVNNRKTIVHSGFEWSPIKILSLRGGIEEEKTTYGIGLDFGRFRFDYASRNYFSISGQLEPFGEKVVDNRINFQDAARQRRKFVPRY